MGHLFSLVICDSTVLADVNQRFPMPRVRSVDLRSPALFSHGPMNGESLPPTSGLLLNMD